MFKHAYTCVHICVHICYLLFLGLPCLRKSEMHRGGCWGHTGSVYAAGGHSRFWISSFVLHSQDAEYRRFIRGISSSQTLAHNCNTNSTIHQLDVCWEIALGLNRSVLPLQVLPWSMGSLQAWGPPSPTQAYADTKPSPQTP